MVNTLIAPDGKKEKIFNALRNKNLINDFEIENISFNEGLLPFYKGVMYYSLSHKDIIADKIMVFLAPIKDLSEIEAITLNPAKIIEMNVKYGLSLNENNLVSYINFFMDCVSTSNEKLFVVEKMSDIDFISKDNPKLRFAEKIINSTSSAISKTENGFLVQCMMYAEDGLFKAEIEVQEDGNFELIKDQLIIKF
jgi:hypothetical protein